MRYFLLVLAFLLSGCSGGEWKERAEREVEIFHEQLNDGDFDSIIDAAHPEFSSGTGREGTRKFFASLQEKFGPFESAEGAGWQVKYDESGNTVTLDYNSQFEKGPVSETFVYRFKDDEIRLYVYNVNSQLLVTQ